MQEFYKLDKLMNNPTTFSIVVRIIGAKIIASPINTFFVVLCLLLTIYIIPIIKQIGMKRVGIIFIILKIFSPVLTIGVSNPIYS